MNWNNTFCNYFFVFPIILECNSCLILICQSVDPSATGNGMEIHHDLSQTQYNTEHAKNGQSNAKIIWYCNWTSKFDTHSSNHSNQRWFARKSQLSSMNFPFCLHKKFGVSQCHGGSSTAAWWNLKNPAVVTAHQVSIPENENDHCGSISKIHVSNPTAVLPVNRCLNLKSFICRIFGPRIGQSQRWFAGKPTNKFNEFLN